MAGRRLPLQALVSSTGQPHYLIHDRGSRAGQDGPGALRASNSGTSCPVGHWSSTGTAKTWPGGLRTRRNALRESDIAGLLQRLVIASTTEDDDEEDEAEESNSSSDESETSSSNEEADEEDDNAEFMNLRSGWQRRGRRMLKRQQTRRTMGLSRSKTMPLTTMSTL